MLTSGSEEPEKSQDPQATMATARQGRIALEGGDYLSKRYQIQSQKETESCFKLPSDPCLPCPSSLAGKR